jgi:hypothetical protein
MVSIKQLKKRLGDVAWRHGALIVAHRREPDGSHVLTVTVPGHLAEDDEPRTDYAPATMGSVVKALPEKG